MATPLALRVVQSEALWYRRAWRGTVISTFLQPVLFLTAMGLGLGSLVDEGGGEADLGIPYLAFIATGLIAATAMQTGASDGAWPVMAGIKWRENFHAILTTPVTASGIVMGRLIWSAIRLTFILVVYAVIMTLFDAVDLGPALLAVFPAVLCGVAFSAPIIAFTAQLEDDTGLTSLFRFGIVPLFLFSGTFFPVDQLPDWMEPLAAATPLFHGVELVRKLALPDLEAPLVSTMPMWVHVLYLAALVVLGTILASRLLQRRLQP